MALTVRPVDGCKLFKRVVASASSSFTSLNSRGVCSPEPDCVLPCHQVRSLPLFVDGVEDGSGFKFVTCFSPDPSSCVWTMGLGILLFLACPLAEQPKRFPFFSTPLQSCLNQQSCPFWQPSSAPQKRQILSWFSGFTFWLMPLPMFSSTAVVITLTLIGGEVGFNPSLGAKSPSARASASATSESANPSTNVSVVGVTSEPKHALAEVILNAAWLEAFTTGTDMRSTAPSRRVASGVVMSIHTYIHTFIHTYIAYMHTCIQFNHMHKYKHKYKHTYIHTYIHCIHAYMHTIQQYAQIQTYIYTMAG